MTSKLWDHTHEFHYQDLLEVFKPCAKEDFEDEITDETVWKINYDNVVNIITYAILQKYVKDREEDMEITFKNIKDLRPLAFQAANDLLNSVLKGYQP